MDRYPETPSPILVEGVEPPATTKFLLEVKAPRAPLRARPDAGVFDPMLWGCPKVGAWT